jgi:hypothetical protein
VRPYLRLEYPFRASPASNGRSQRVASFGLLLAKSTVPASCRQPEGGESSKRIRLARRTGLEPRAFWFYKRGCQEKKLSRELEAAKSFGIQPPLPLCRWLEV